MKDRSVRISKRMVEIGWLDYNWEEGDVEEERKRSGRFYRRIEAAVCTQYEVV